MVRTRNPEKRERLLSAALALFVKNGVQNTTTAEIAKAAGMAAGTLFLYFPTKQDLINALVLKIGKAQADNINHLLEPALSARDSFFRIWSASSGWFLENMDAYLFIQQVRESSLIPAAVVMESDQFFGFYYAAIQKGNQEGILKPYPADLIGAFLYQGLVAVMSYLRIQTDPGKHAEIIQQGFDIFWDGIRSRS
jgi:AcrR family transcriptional regulator